ncbi:MAG TPA: cupin domain-containing protein [Verrucomicrobiae bacterium]|nr:cupin domain-containing protein [Verrucomicrobiae bacterium]
MNTKESARAKSCTPIVHALPDTGSIPNNAKCPLLIYRYALVLPADNPASAIEQLLAANRWGGAWRNGVYPFHHYHSTAHEVLVCCRGSAKAQFGGEPGVVEELQKGDVVLIPAGTGHKNLGASDDFQIVGGYPRGQDWDMCYGKPGERPEADHRIARVLLPEADPIYGVDGPLLKHWKT